MGAGMPSPIKFNTDEWQGASKFRSRSSKMVRFVMKYSGGMITTPQQAQLVLLLLAVLMLGASYFMLPTQEERVLVAPPGQTIIYPENAPPRLQR